MFITCFSIQSSGGSFGSCRCHRTNCPLGPAVLADTWSVSGAGPRVHGTHGPDFVPNCRTDQSVHTRTRCPPQIAAWPESSLQAQTQFDTFSLQSPHSLSVSRRYSTRANLVLNCRQANNMGLYCACVTGPHKEKLAINRYFSINR